jgi:hypothetical protein
MSISGIFGIILGGVSILISQSIFFTYL